MWVIPQINPKHAWSVHHLFSQVNPEGRKFIRRQSVKGEENRKVKLPIVLEGNRRDGYTVTCPALPGCVSEGDTREEALKNIREAIRLYLRAVTREHILPKKVKASKGLEALEVKVATFTSIGE